MRKHLIKKADINTLRTNGKDKSYSRWIRNRGETDDGNVQEPPEANPDVLPAPAEDRTAEAEAVRTLLDDPTVRLQVFSPLEAAIFMTVHVDGKAEREAAALLGRSHKEVRRAVLGVRRIVRRTISRVTAGLPIV